MAAYSRIGRTIKGFISSFLFCLFFFSFFLSFFLVADLKVAPEEAKCVAGFVGNGVDMDVPFPVVLDADTKVLCGGDVSNGMSMQLI